MQIKYFGKLILKGEISEETNWEIRERRDFKKCRELYHYNYLQNYRYKPLSRVDHCTFGTLLSVSVLTVFEPNSLDIFSFIFGWPYHSPSLKHLTLGFLNAGLVFPPPGTDGPQFLWLHVLVHSLSTRLPCVLLRVFSSQLLESCHPVLRPHLPPPDK